MKTFDSGREKPVRTSESLPVIERLLLSPWSEEMVDAFDKIWRECQLVEEERSLSRSFFLSFLLSLSLSLSL